MEFIICLLIMLMSAFSWFVVHHLLIIIRLFLGVEPHQYGKTIEDIFAEIRGRNGFKN